MGVHRWWLVSDLHLGSLEARGRDTAAAFALFLHTVVAPVGDGSSLVLLGDTVDALGAGGPARAVLDEFAMTHPEVVEALRGCVERGVHVEVVTGNHDVGLARPAAARRLRELLGDVGGSEAGRVRVLPWALYVPGVMFAEHGHQHHSVHRLPTLLHAAADDDTPLGPSALSAWAASGGGVVGRSSAAARALLAARLAERQSRELGYRALVYDESARLGLSGEAGWALWSLSRLRLGPAVVGTMGRVARRRLSPGNGTASMPPRAAADVAATLAAHGASVPWYVTGHTHRAAAAPLPTVATGWLNTGTWCSDIRGPGPDRDDPRRFPYAVVEARDGGATTAHLRYWRDPVTGHRGAVDSAVGH